MMLFFVVHVFLLNAQENPDKILIDKNGTSSVKTNNDSIPTIDLFTKTTVQNNSTQIDTSLTIHSEYLHNYQQKDLLGKVLLANEGHFYNDLVFNPSQVDVNPEFGFLGKQQNYMKTSDVFYYRVATPFTEIQYRSVMEQGQILNSTFSINTSENLNFSIGYRGLRSLGKYVNDLSSNGNFWFSANFSSKSKKYKLKTHFAGQDLSNQENGGIINTEAFESGDPAFNDRTRFDVYLTDASSFFKGQRFYINHSYQLSKNTEQAGLSLFHNLQYEYKFYEYKQTTLRTLIDNVQFSRFGDAYVSTSINDQSRFNNLKNQAGASWSNKTLGDFSVFVESNQLNYFFNKVLFLEGQVIPNGINERINNFGGSYQVDMGKLSLNSKVSKSISNQNIFDFNANLTFKIDSLQHITATISAKNKLVDFQKRLYQSDFVGYNWVNNFNNEKYNTISVETKNKWLNGLVQLNNINDFTYYGNDAEIAENPVFQQLILSPKQYNKSITHFSVQANKEFFISKFGFDNAIIYQEVAQDDQILNVPKFIVRQSTYYSNRFFKKALFLQTGFTFNYFSSYYGNGYNPILGDFFVQNQKLIGDFPVIDVFVNAKIQTFRVFLKYEHINSLFTNDYYYAAPNQPFRDGILRFGVTWNFFQ